MALSLRNLGRRFTRKLCRRIFTPAPVPAHRPKMQRLGLETLEDRTCPSTLTNWLGSGLGYLTSAGQQLSGSSSPTLATAGYVMQDYGNQLQQAVASGNYSQLMSDAKSVWTAAKSIYDAGGSVWSALTNPTSVATLGNALKDVLSVPGAISSQPVSQMSQDYLTAFKDMLGILVPAAGGNWGTAASNAVGPIVQAGELLSQAWWPNLIDQLSTAGANAWDTSGFNPYNPTSFNGDTVTQQAAQSVLNVVNGFLDGGVAGAQGAAIPSAYQLGTSMWNSYNSNSAGGSSTDPQNGTASGSGTSTSGLDLSGGWAVDPGNMYAGSGWDIQGGTPVDPSTTYVPPGWDIQGGTPVDPSTTYVPPGWDIQGGTPVDPSTTYVPPGWDIQGGTPVDPSTTYVPPGWDIQGGTPVDPSSTYYYPLGTSGYNSGYDTSGLGSYGTGYDTSGLGSYGSYGTGYDTSGLGSYGSYGTGYDTSGLGSYGSYGTGYDTSGLGSYGSYGTGYDTSGLGSYGTSGLGSYGSYGTGYDTSGLGSYGSGYDSSGLGSYSAGTGYDTSGLGSYSTGYDTSGLGSYSSGYGYDTSGLGSYSSGYDTSGYSSGYDTSGYSSGYDTSGYSSGYDSGSSGYDSSGSSYDSGVSFESHLHAAHANMVHAVAPSAANTPQALTVAATADTHATQPGQHTDSVSGGDALHTRSTVTVHIADLNQQDSVLGDSHGSALVGDAHPAQLPQTAMSASLHPAKVDALHRAVPSAQDGHATNNVDHAQAKHVASNAHHKLGNHGTESVDFASHVKKSHGNSATSKKTSTTKPATTTPSTPSATSPQAGSQSSALLTQRVGSIVSVEEKLLKALAKALREGAKYAKQGAATSSSAKKSAHGHGTKATTGSTATGSSSSKAKKSHHSKSGK
jgi:hypothetical protein